MKEKEESIILYGLRLKSTQNILAYYYITYPENEYNELGCRLRESNSHDIKLWLTKDAQHAEFVRNHKPEWYNADYDHPENPFDSNDLEVIEIKLKTHIKPINIKLPETGMWSIECLH